MFCLGVHGEELGDGRVDAILAAWTSDEVECDVVYTHTANGWLGRRVEVPPLRVGIREEGLAAHLWWQNGNRHSRGLENRFDEMRAAFRQRIA